MKKSPFIIVIIVLALAIGGFVFYSLYKTRTAAALDDSNATTTSNSAPDAAEQEANAQAEAAVNSNPAPLRYENKQYGFSFDKPEGFTVGALHEDAGDSILVQPSAPAVTASSSAAVQDPAHSGFQIYISALDAPMELTPDLIKTEIPGISVNNAERINLDGKGKGMMFYSNSDSFGGKSFEIWFVVSPDKTNPTNKTDLLYQITSYASFAPQLQKIIGTWKFN